jgi:hypothetical protein
VRAARLVGPLLMVVFCLGVAGAQALVRDAAGPTPVDGPWLVQTGRRVWVRGLPPFSQKT